MQKYAVLNKNKHTLGGLLAIKRSGLSDAAKLLNYAVQEFKNELLKMMSLRISWQLKMASLKMMTQKVIMMT